MTTDRQTTRQIRFVLLILFCHFCSFLAFSQRYVQNEFKKTDILEKVSGNVSANDEKAFEIALKLKILKDVCQLTRIPDTGDILGLAKKLRNKEVSISDFIRFYYPGVKAGITVQDFEVFEETGSKKDYVGTMKATCTCSRENYTVEKDFPPLQGPLTPTKEGELVFLTHLPLALAAIDIDVAKLPKVNARMLKEGVKQYIEREYGYELEYDFDADPIIIESILTGDIKVISYATFGGAQKVREEPKKGVGFSYHVGVDQNVRVAQSAPEDFVSFSSDLTHNLAVRIPLRKVYASLQANMTTGAAVATSAREWGTDESFYGFGIGFGTMHQHLNPGIQLNYRSISFEEHSLTLLGMGVGVDFSKGKLQFGLAYRMDVILADLEQVQTAELSSGLTDYLKNSVGNLSFGITKYF